ncbi:MAG: ribosomal protein S18-alanine N-acetyltransferase [Lachnospiraceae bacterium]|nr:ribosomal protein S18-alanine N-acetyltransferase [Lachnospiraceae bacterium]
MNIRYMKKEDLDQVWGIEQTLFSKPWSKQDFLDALSKEENIYIVAEDKEQILGYCGIWGVAGEGQITNVAVKKEYQGKGIATSLFCDVLKKGETKELHVYTLEVRVSNNRAIHLYEKMGFVSAGVRKNFYELPTEDAVIMWKE